MRRYVLYNFLNALNSNQFQPFRKTYSCITKLITRLDLAYLQPLKKLLQSVTAHFAYEF